MSNWSGKVAMVTGGAQGIGRAIAEQFLEGGAQVVIVDHDREAGLEAQADLAAAGDIGFFHADVADEDAVAGCMDEIAERFGFLDFLINNAAISKRMPVQELSVEQFRRVMDVNVTGAFICAKYARQQLMENHGCIVNITSTRALMSEPDTEAYSASKGGLLALTHALAASFAPEVRVNCVSPGWIDVSDWKKTSLRRSSDLSHQDHAQHWAGRVGMPQDVAALVLFLCLPQAGFITGSHYVVDGGMTRKMIYTE